MDKEKDNKEPKKKADAPVEEVVKVEETPKTEESPKAEEAPKNEETPKAEEVKTAGSKKGWIIAVIILGIIGILGLIITAVAVIISNPGLLNFGGNATPTPTSEVVVSQTPGVSESLTPTVTVTPSVSPTVTPTLVPLSVSVVSTALNPSATSCPTTFQFSAQITTNRAASVKYKWERSDGTSGAIQTLNFAAAGTQTVNTVWVLGASTTGWMRVRVTEPSVVVSNNATFTLTCNHSGSWYNNFGTMTITQVGTAATIEFINLKIGGGGGTGTVTGTFTGPNFTGSYGYSSVVTWTFNDAFNSFTGSWTSGSSTGEWCGAKTGSAFPAGCSYAGRWNEWVGGLYLNHEACQPGTQTLILARTNNTVSGSYCNGTLSGTITYNSPYEVFTGTFFATGGGSDDVTFYMDDYNGDVFNGNYSGGVQSWCGRRSSISSIPSGCLFTGP